MPRTTFNTRPALTLLGDALTLFTMAGLTVASAAVIAHALPEPAPLPQLPTVVVTAKAAALPQLPTVVVVAKRATPEASAQF